MKEDLQKVSTELLQALNDLGKEKGIEPEVILEGVAVAAPDFCL